jgi:magnesium-transporting ATPase (P-type)
VLVCLSYFVWGRFQGKVVGLFAGILVALAVAMSAWTGASGAYATNGVITAVWLGVSCYFLCCFDTLTISIDVILAKASAHMILDDKCHINNKYIIDLLACTTDICCDKSAVMAGSLLVSEAWIGGRITIFERPGVNATDESPVDIATEIQVILKENAYLNRQGSNRNSIDSHGNVVVGPNFKANEVEDALVALTSSWATVGDFDGGSEADSSILSSNHSLLFKEGIDKFFKLDPDYEDNSVTVIHRPNGSIRIYYKNRVAEALTTCANFLDTDGSIQALTPEIKQEILEYAERLVEERYSVLVLAHRDYDSVSTLALNLHTLGRHNMEITQDYCVDCVMGYYEPVHLDIPQSIKLARSSGINLRMVTDEPMDVTQDIARKAGLLTSKGMIFDAWQLPTLQQGAADHPEAMQHLQALAGASFLDKAAILNELRAFHEGPPVVVPIDKIEDRRTIQPGVLLSTGASIRDIESFVLPHVSVALCKTGTEMTAEAADVVVTDDKFSSILNAIRWGRTVQESVQRYLQYRMTGAIVACSLLLASAIKTVTSTSVQSLFYVSFLPIHLFFFFVLLDSFGVAAYCYQPVSSARISKHKRSRALVNKHVLRNIICQSVVQLAALLIVLLYIPRKMNINEDVECLYYTVQPSAPSAARWDPFTLQRSDTTGAVSCALFASYCPSGSVLCYMESQSMTFSNGATSTFTFEHLAGFSESCLSCTKWDYSHQTMIFTTYTFMQAINLLNSAEVYNRQDVFHLDHIDAWLKFPVIAMIGMQIIAVFFGGEHLRTTHLHATAWAVCIGLGFAPLATGFLYRLLLPLRSRTEKDIRRIQLFRPDLAEQRRQSKRGSLKAKSKVFDFVEDLDKIAL